ncbi:MAG: permease-like cell division protein FtsX [Lentimicrobiaceae bacterium]|jgi:cell division transport system permease protein|nr:permease-like cell division protein FtsX [Lentimicrobiaceae bacterium]MDD4596928.1 permease-like cell division protein FtsX [Lentimicrobiaceae bacterium]MDY0025794.1 permease-like cell division protein FtsX [Lentimicrobium sp.]
MARSDDRLNRRRLQTSTATTIISISLVLFMLGLLGLIVLHANKLSDYVKENIGFSVIIKEEVKEPAIIEFQKKLDLQPYVKSTQYISKEQAAEDLTKDLGEDFVDFLGYNPLLATVDIHLKANYANNDSLVMIEQELIKNQVVKEVFYHKSLVELVNSNIRKISIVLLFFTLILLLISIALISNTIRLSVYSKRFIIKSMLLVGATQAFIRKPFLLKSLLHGLISAVIAVVLLAVVLYFSRSALPELVDLQDIDMFLTLFGMVTVLGLIITGISTLFAIRRYLRISNDKLYI